MSRSYRTGPLALALCASLAALPALAGTTDPANSDYAKARKLTVKMAESLQSYDLKGAMTMSRHTKGQTDGMTVSAEMVAAARWPDRLLSAQTGEMVNLTLGTGPERSWFLLGQLGNAYIGEPMQLTRDLEHAAARELSEAKIFNFYGGLGQFVLPADLQVTPDTGRETLLVNDREISCQVFRTMGPEMVRAEGQPVEGPRTYYFDPTSGLVLKSEMTLSFQRNGTQYVQEVSFAVSEFALNTEVSDSRFHFEAPAGTRIVDNLDLLTNPDAMTGQPAPDVTFTDLEGKTLQLSDLRGGPVFIDFWATWCPPCRQEMPHIETLYHELGKTGRIEIIAASSEDPATIRKFLAKTPYSFPIMTVKDSDAHTKYKATSIPVGFVIDAEGVIRAHLVGAQTEQQLRDAFAKAGVR